jgi:DNA-binding CsgD family transcriptional regulator
MFNEPQAQEMIDLYETGKTQKEIAEIFMCSQTAISAILLKRHISTRIGKKITYTDVNTSFFKEINNEESAYFLGFLYADGCVQIKNTTYVISLKLKSNDQIIIEKFRDIISPSSPIKITQNKGSPNTYSYFRVHQKEICEQLISLGCAPNKSLILEFPTKVPTNLIKHFLRGYSDGDGSIYKNKLKHNINTIWKIISTKQFCEKAAEILKNELNITCSQSLAKPKKNKITTILSVGGNNQTEKVLDWLYQDATIYLPRKHQKYLEFKEDKITRPYRECKKLNLSINDKNQIVQLYNDGMSSNKIAKQFGISKPSILTILHDHNVNMRPNAVIKNSTNT